MLYKKAKKASAAGHGKKKRAFGEKERKTIKPADVSERNARERKKCFFFGQMRQSLACLVKKGGGTKQIGGVIFKEIFQVSVFASTAFILEGGGKGYVLHNASTTKRVARRVNAAERKNKKT